MKPFVVCIHGQIPDVCPTCKPILALVRAAHVDVKPRKLGWQPSSIPFPVSLDDAGRPVHHDPGFDLLDLTVGQDKTHPIAHPPWTGRFMFPGSAYQNEFLKTFPILEPGTTVVARVLNTLELFESKTFVLVGDELFC